MLRNPLRGAALLALLSLLSTACESSGVGGGTEPAGPEAWLGEGLKTFRLLEPSDKMALHLGIQGNYMLYVAYRARGIDPGDDNNPKSPRNPRTTVWALDGDDILAAVTRKTGLSPVGDGTYEEVGTILVFPSVIKKERYLDADILLHVEITDVNGKVASTTVALHTYLASTEAEPIPPLR